MGAAESRRQGAEAPRGPPAQQGVSEGLSFLFAGDGQNVSRRSGIGGGRKLGLLPPPLWGRVGEGGKVSTERAATPVPLPPPRGGRERCGAGDSNIGARSEQQARPAPRSPHLSQATIGLLLMLPAVLLLALLMVYPVLYGVWISFFNKHSFFPEQTFIGLDNYLFLLRDP